MQFQRATAAFAVIIVSVLLSAGTVYGQASPLWGDLKPGPHAVGFQTQFQWDPARPYKPKTDYQGKMLPGERSRPMQISYWYPAQAGGERLSFAYYLALTATEEKGGEATAEQREQAIQAFLKSRWSTGADEAKLKEVPAMKMMAVRNAKPAAGRYPLLLISHSTGMSFPYGNSVLGEYLASHGYVVATGPAMGASGRRLTFDTIGVMAQMQDQEALIRELRKNAIVDPDKLALIGFSFGALSSSLLAMHNTDVDAFVSLDGSQWNRFGYSVLFQNPLYEPVRMKMPVLHVTVQENSPDITTSFIQAIKYSPVTTVAIKARNIDFSTLGAVSAHVPKFGGADPLGDPKVTHQVALIYTQKFLDATVKNDAQAKGFIANTPDANGFPKEMTTESRKALPRPPSEQEFVAILKEKGIPKATEILRAAKSVDPEYNLFEPETLNAISTEYIENKKTKDAVELMKLNLEAFPGDADVYDYLGRAYMADGDKVHAIEYFTKSLEINPDNPTAQEMLKKLQS